MSAKKSIARFLELRKQYPSGYAMWHARWATHGVKNEQNCHPFVVGGDERTYLAHNGVLDITIHKSDKRSDTRVFAEDTLPKIGGVSALDDDNIYIMVESWASGSKIAILTCDPTAQHPMYLINEKAGTWDNDGIWWSNQSHKRNTYATPPKPVTAVPTTQASGIKYPEIWFDDEADDEQIVDVCPYCETIADLHENPYYCTICQSCYDCGILIDDCLCYTPNKNWQSTRSLGQFFY
jgi:glutamine amidotransferase